MTFDDWKQGFIARSGFSLHLADQLSYLAAPVAADGAQQELSNALGDYVGRRVTDRRINIGRQMLEQYKTLFQSIENDFGVDAQVLVAIWGVESNFGEIMGDIPVFAALATLAFEGRRRPMFEAQLLAAADMVQRGGIPARKMIGSWAGAMGHMQFMPSTYRDYALAPTGRVADIWADDPADALRSAANYLCAQGWQHKHPWALQAKLPARLDLFQARHHAPQTLVEWQSMGVDVAARKGVDGVFTLLLPSGSHGPAFLTSPNYRALLAYNNAPSYAIAVGHLADRIAGQAPLPSWGADGAGLTRADMARLQQMLCDLGYGAGVCDGIWGPNTEAAIEQYQQAQGLPADGFADYAMLQRLIG